MTLAVRNTVIRVGAVLAVILITTFGIIAYRAVQGSLLNELAGTWHHSWLAWSWQVGLRQVVASLLATGVLGVVAMVGLVWAVRVFRRVNSAEVYFFVLFLVGLALEQVRVVQLYAFSLNLPAVYGTVLTRIVVAARIMGASSLFVASLYAVGVEYPRIGSLTIAVGVLAFLFVYFIPVDTITVGATMVHRIGGQASLELTLLIAAALTVVNYVIAGIRGHRDRGFLLAGAVLAIVAGEQISRYVPSIAWLVVGAGLLVFGVLSFMLVTRDHFRWY